MKGLYLLDFHSWTFGNLTDHDKNNVWVWLWIKTAVNHKAENL